MLKKVLLGLCALPLLAQASIQAPTGARVALAYNEPGQAGSQGIHADAFMIPASTQKVLTALAASLYLGKEWRFKTRLLAPTGALAQAKQTGVLQGDLVLEFNGAPDLTRQALVNLLAYLKQQGVSQIQGDLLLDTGHYAGYDRGNGWSWNDLSICFTAPASAVIVDRNCVYAQLEANRITSYNVCYTKLLRGAGQFRAVFQLPLPGPYELGSDPTGAAGLFRRHALQPEQCGTGGLAGDGTAGA